MKAAISYVLSNSNEQIIVISYLYYFQVKEWKKLSEHINKN